MTVVSRAYLRKLQQYGKLPDVELISAREASELMGCSRRTVERLVASGTLLPKAKLPGRTGAFVFRRADVERLAERRQTRRAS